MNLIDALKWTVVHRAIGTAAFAAGFLLFAVGMVAGFGGAVEAFLNDPFDPRAAAEAADPTALVVMAAVGFVVWQFGKTFALYATLPRATAERSAGSVDANKIRSEVLDALDGRLAEMESELEATRRAVEEATDDGHARTYDEADAATGSAAAGGESGSSRSHDRPPSSPSDGHASATATSRGEGTARTDSRGGAGDDRA